MDTLKKFFPLSFQRNGSVGDFVVGIIIYVVVAIVAGALIALASLITGWIPVAGPILGWLLGILGSLVEVYTIAGIVIKILVYCKVLK